MLEWLYVIVSYVLCIWVLLLQLCWLSECQTFTCHLQYLQLF